MIVVEKIAPDSSLYWFISGAKRPVAEENTFEVTFDNRVSITAADNPGIPESRSIPIIMQ